MKATRTVCLNHRLTMCNELSAPWNSNYNGMSHQLTIKSKLYWWLRINSPEEENIKL